MRLLYASVAGALLLCTLAAADPAPSFFGDTGVILTPNALTAERHVVSPHWHSISGTIGEDEGNASGNWDAAGALVGLTDRLELYLGYFSFDDDPFYGGYDEGHFVSHIKARALTEADDGWDLAIGIRNMGLDTRGDGDHDPTAYGVVSKTVCGSAEEDSYLRLSFGMQFANEDDWLNEEYWPEDNNGHDFDRESLFGSAEWTLNRHVTLLAEIQEANDDDNVFNFGARLSPCDSITADVFFIDDDAADDYDLAIGVSGFIPFDSSNVLADEDRHESHAHSAPSIFGDTGMILMPNAITAPRHTVTPVYHRVTSGIGDDEYNPNDIGDWENVGVLVGTTDRLEVYAGVLAFDDDVPPETVDPWHDDDFVFHAKAQALREPDNWCNVAVGVRNVGLSDVGDYGENEPSAYFVGTKTICASEEDGSFLRASVGLLIANQDGLLNSEYFPGEDGNYDDSSLFGGAEWMICKKLTLLGEVIEVGDDDTAFNFGARLVPLKNVTVDALFVDDVQKSEHEFAWGVSYRHAF